MHYSGEAVRRWAAKVLGRLSEEDRPLWLVLPGLVAFSAFMFYPVLYTVYLSLTNATRVTLFNPDRPYDFVGLANYQEVLADPEFWNSIGVTWLFVGTSVTLKIAVGIGIAMVLTHDRVRGKRYMRSLVIAPMGFPVIFTVAVWRGIFSSGRSGLANQLLLWISDVVPWVTFSHIPWLQERWLAFFAYNVTEAWLAYPFMVIITVSALQNVNGELLDAAKVDGAGYLARVRHVVLPSIKRPVMFASILTAAASFNQFLIPFVFNQGGPARKNELIIVYGYREAFSFDSYGQGAAIMLIAVLFIGTFMWVNVKKGRLAEGVAGE